MSTMYLSDDVEVLVEDTAHIDTFELTWELN